MVDVGAQLDEKFDRANVTFARSVVHRCLAIFVLPVHIVFADVDEVLDHVIVALATGIEDGCLFQDVFLGRVNAQLHQKLNHAESDSLVRYDAGGKHERLTKVLGLVYHGSYIDIMFADQLLHLVDKTLLYFVEQGPPERI